MKKIDVISYEELLEMAEHFFGDMVKGVVDIEKKILVLDAELQSDLETYLLSEGSNQDDLWGINLYPDLDGENFLEFDSLINIRPRQGNRSRNVEDSSKRDIIRKIVLEKVRR